MGDFGQYLFETYKEGALKGYKDDAETALDYVISYITKSDIPENIKDYTTNELIKIREQKDAKFAFYINKKGKGKRPEKEILERNLEIAKYVHEHKNYKDGVLRSTPLTDEAAIGDVTDLDQPLCEETIRNAYYEMPLIY
jgi:hypothetical protein